MHIYPQSFTLLLHDVSHPSGTGRCSSTYDAATTSNLFPRHLLVPSSVGCNVFSFCSSARLLHALAVALLFLRHLRLNKAKTANYDTADVDDIFPFFFFVAWPAGVRKLCGDLNQRPSFEKSSVGSESPVYYYRCRSNFFTVKYPQSL